MLNPKIIQATSLFIRFIGSWFVSTFLFSIIFLIQSRLNYKFKFHENWRYELSYSFKDVFIASSFGFLIISLVYFFCIVLFKRDLRNYKRRYFFSAIITVIILFSFAFMWGNPFYDVNIFYSLFVIILMGLIGLSISLTDKLIKKGLEKSKR